VRRRLCLAVALLFGACATTENARTTAFLKDAHECESDADNQLREVGRVDPGIRLLFFRSCMVLRGWPGE